jgi:hypothetical protein
MGIWITPELFANGCFMLVFDVTPDGCDSDSHIIGSPALSPAALDRASVTLKLPELKCLLLNLTALSDQLPRYKLAEYDVSAYAQSVAGATAFIPDAESACHFVQHDVFFQEINGYL